MHYIQLYNKTQWENCKGRRPWWLQLETLLGILCVLISPFFPCPDIFTFLIFLYRMSRHIPLVSLFLNGIISRSFIALLPLPISFHLFSPFLFIPLPPHFLTAVTTIVCSSLILCSSLRLFSSYLSLFLTQFSSSPVTAAHSTKFRHTSLYLSNWKQWLG